MQQPAATQVRVQMHATNRCNSKGTNRKTVECIEVVITHNVFFRHAAIHTYIHTHTHIYVCIYADLCFMFSRNHPSSPWSASGSETSSERWCRGARSSSGPFLHTGTSPGPRPRIRIKSETSTHLDACGVDGIIVFCHMQIVVDRVLTRWMVWVTNARSFVLSMYMRT